MPRSVGIFPNFPDRSFESVIAVVLPPTQPVVSPRAPPDPVVSPRAPPGPASAVIAVTMPDPGAQWFSYPARFSPRAPPGPGIAVIAVTKSHLGVQWLSYFPGSGRPR
ncbi:hypothetical protein GCM10009555_027300 [Acrocarpospora macrocephala]|uniref:Uncharacterized protein n=1 Tax=Acrocarpospora macrocephala TaxID=150177 RepID=A0A5M3WNG8_9ACTN|nr:hypothetical protein Amac_044420 [Acrocarpospora macrocephala]